MAKKDLNEVIEVPEGVSAQKDGTKIAIKGPKGECAREFNNPGVDVSVEGNQIKLVSKKASKVEKAVINAYKVHINNAIKGTQEPYVYKLKVCSGHFPMNVAVQGEELVIKNFYGEKVPRRVKLKKGADVKVQGAEIVVVAADKELAGQVSADIEQATRRPGFDRRIFQDGIYIVEKAGKEI